MNLCPFGIAYENDEYRAIRTASYTYVKTPQGASMLFDNKNDPYQMNNLVNKQEFASIQTALDKQLVNELSRIGETEIKPREYYLKKFDYFEKKEFQPTYHIADYKNVEIVVSPNKSFSIK